MEEAGSCGHDSAISKKADKAGKAEGARDLNMHGCLARYSRKGLAWYIARWYEQVIYSYE